MVVRKLFLLSSFHLPSTVSVEIIIASDRDNDRRRNQVQGWVREDLAEEGADHGLHTSVKKLFGILHSVRYFFADSASAAAATALVAMVPDPCADRPCCQKEGMSYHSLMVRVFLSTNLLST